MEDRTQGEVTDRGEVVVVHEVAEAVGDQVTVIELNASKHVRAARDDEAGAVIDGVVGEQIGVAAILAHVVLARPRHVVRVHTLSTRVHVDDDDLRALARLVDQDLRLRVVQEIVGVRVGCEVHEGHPDLAFANDGDLTGQSGLGDARRA